jgi:hypothetical protein
MTHKEIEHNEVFKTLLTEDKAFYNAYIRDDHQTARFWTSTNEDGEIQCNGFNESTHHSNVYYQKGMGHAVIYPSHPRYAEYDFPETEVEPSSSEEEVILGKIIAKWDIREVVNDSHT